jgi:hypothetical protein
LPRSASHRFHCRQSTRRVRGGGPSMSRAHSSLPGPLDPACWMLPKICFSRPTRADPAESLTEKAAPTEASAVCASTRTAFEWGRRRP